MLINNRILIRIRDAGVKNTIYVANEKAKKEFLGCSIMFLKKIFSFVGGRVFGRAPKILGVRLGAFPFLGGRAQKFLGEFDLWFYL